MLVRGLIMIDSLFEKWRRENRCNELAEQHAEWLASTVYEIVKVVYREAFKHGWKHAEEELRK